MYSQNNQLVQNAKWYISTSGNAGNACYLIKNFNQYFRGDSIINGNQYFKLTEVGHYYYMQGSQAGVCPSTSIPYSINLSILVRYDQKKLLTWSTTTNQDEVFLDYNLHVGDTITNVGFTSVLGANVKLPVTNIDSILVNGIYLKRFYYAGAMGTKYIIEKIGSIQGFLDTYSYDFEGGSSLNCYSENLVVLYNEPSSTLNCDITLNLKETTIAQDNISIFPNPAHNEFKITIKNGEEIKKAFIKNYLGQVIIEFNQQNSSNNYNISSLSNGVYFITIETSTGSISKKLIKQ